MVGDGGGGECHPLVPTGAVRACCGGGTIVERLWVGDTPSETNSSHLKMDGWKTRFLLGWLPGRCYVSFRECTPPSKTQGLFHPKRDPKEKRK